MIGAFNMNVSRTALLRNGCGQVAIGAELAAREKIRNTDQTVI